MSYIAKDKCKILEGELRLKELIEYLDKYELPKFVWISEDATGIVSKVEYDAQSNQLTGLVLPLHEQTGNPIAFSYLASSADEIRNSVEKEKSTHVHLVLAQPLVEGVPPIIIQIFGTSNKYRANHVSKRWNTLEDSLNKYVFQIVYYFNT